MRDPLDSLSTPQRIATLVKDSQDALSTIHQMMDDERAFCWDLEQYSSDTGNTLNRQRIQPRDQSVFRLARFRASWVLKVAPYFKARGIDAMTDPQTGKWARWAVEFDISDPVKRFDRVCRDTVWSAFTSRIGCMAVDWNPDAGVFGDTRFRHVDGKNIGWAPPFNDPHDPECPWFYEIVRMRPEAIKRQMGWKDTDDVLPDTGLPSSGGRDNTVTASGKVSFDAGGKGGIDEMSTQRFVTVVLFWERFSGKKRETVGYRPLSDEERYMVIAQGDRAGEKVAIDYGPDPLPEMDVLGDGTPIKRIDALLDEEERLAYPNGKLTICAPWSGQGRVFYEGDWPQRMRTIPYLVWQPYANPFRQIGTSDVDLNWTMTLVKNATWRRWYEQLQESRGMLLLPGKGLKDLNDEPFVYSDANGFVALYDTAMPPQNIQMVAGPQPSPQLERFLAMVEGNLRSQEGSSDIANTGNPDELKGITATTMERAVQSGNVPMDDFVSSWQGELGLFLSVLHDIQRARWTEARWIRYIGGQGTEAWIRMRGADIPAADILITAKPTLDSLRSERLDSVLKLAQLAAQNPAAAKVAARQMDVDPDDLNDILSAAVPPVPTGGPTPPGPMGPPPPSAPVPPGPSPEMIPG